MRMATPPLEQESVALSSSSPLLEMPPRIDVTPEEVHTMMLYLRRARDRAIEIRERSPAGSYLESVLARTINGITLELSQLDYLLACKPVNVARETRTDRRMRPAI